MNDEAAHPSSHPTGGCLALALLVNSFEHAKHSQQPNRPRPRDVFQVLLLDSSSDACP